MFLDFSLQCVTSFRSGRNFLSISFNNRREYNHKTSEATKTSFLFSTTSKFDNELKSHVHKFVPRKILSTGIIALTFCIGIGISPEALTIIHDNQPLLLGQLFFFNFDIMFLMYPLSSTPRTRRPQSTLKSNDTMPNTCIFFLTALL